MKELFKKGFKLETISLRSLNEAYYENDETLKRSKCRQAKITTEVALKRLQGDYFHYQVCYKDHFATDYIYFFESLIDTLKSYLDYCNLVLN